MITDNCAGFTLVELSVATAIIGIGAGLTTMAIATSRPPARSQVLEDVAAARSTAIRRGEKVSWMGGDQPIVFYPDGSSGGGVVSIGDNRVTIDRLTGVARAIP